MQGQGLVVLESCGLWHAGWFARKGPGPSWRLQSQPTQAPVLGSRYGKCVQECCFCLEPLSRSDGAPSL